MISLLFYAFFLLNLFISCSKKKSNTIAFVFWFILFLVFAGNNRTGFSDLIHYAYAYNLKVSYFYFSEVGYSTLADFLSNQGYSFHFFLGFIFIFCSLFIWLTTRKLKCNYNLLLSLYALFYLFYVMEGLRFFMAMSIIVFAYYVLSKDTKISLLVAVLLFALAFLFHNQSLFLAPFILFYKVKNTKWKRNILIIFCLIFVVLNLINGNSANYLLKLAPGVFGDIIDRYGIATYMNSSTRFGFILYDAYFVFNIIIASNLKKIKNFVEIEDKNLTKFIDLNYQANIYSVIYMPLVMFNSTFFRFTLVNCNFNFIAIAMMLSMNNPRILKSNRWVYIVFSIIGFTLLWWILRENVLWFFEALAYNIYN